MMLKEYFYNVKCDCCGKLANEELWNNEPYREEIIPEGEYKFLGGKDYCENCWWYQDDNTIATKDGRVWNEDTEEEINTMEE